MKKLAWFIAGFCLLVGLSGCETLAKLGIKNPFAPATNQCPGGVCGPVTLPGGGNGGPGCGPTGCPPVAVTSAIPGTITASPVEWCPNLTCVKQKAVATGKRIVLVMVGSKGCPWCDWMRDVVCQDEPLRVWLEKNGIEIYTEMNNGVCDPEIAALITPRYGVPYTAVLGVNPDGSFKVIDGGMSCEEWVKTSDYTVRTNPAFIRETALALMARLEALKKSFCPQC